MCEYIIFSESTGLYFYSSWLQANAAMFAIVFIFAVYKLQSLQNHISDIKREILLGMPGTIDRDTFHKFFDPNKRQEAIAAVDDDYYKKELNLMSNLIDKNKKIRTWVRPMFILLPISLISNGVLITVSSHLHELGFYFEAIPMFVVLVFQLILIIKLISVTKQIFYRNSEI